MSLWLPHSALTTRLSVVPSVRTVTHLRHLQPPTTYYNQILVLYNPRLHHHHARHYSTQRPPSSTISSSAPAQLPQAQQTSTSPISKLDDKSSVPAEPVPPLMTRVWTKVKHEASHYWHGTKLLASDIRISSRLLASLLKGKTLTRREHRQVRSIPTRHSESLYTVLFLTFHIASFSINEVDQNFLNSYFLPRGPFV
jgi:LETM1 and EF-hand domain-containing protein 1, mitochondrial